MKDGTGIARPKTRCRTLQYYINANRKILQNSKDEQEWIRFVWGICARRNRFSQKAKAETASAASVGFDVLAEFLAKQCRYDFYRNRESGPGRCRECTVHSEAILSPKEGC
jgi:hypothetical protein